MRVRRRRWPFVVAALLLVLGGAFAIVVSLVRPVVIAPEPGAPETHRALPFRLMQTVDDLAHPRSLNDPAALAAAESYAASQLEAAGYSVYREEIRHPPGSTHHHPPTHDVLTRAPATGRFVLLAAHLDTVPGSPGADDDASGVAVVLEVARLLAHGPASRHVVFALFNEEESGLWGSRQYVSESLPFLKKRLLTAVVLDPVGFVSPVPSGQRAPFPLNHFVPDRADFIAAITLRESRAVADRFVSARTAAAPALALAVLHPPRLLAERLRDLWRSDHAPFWKAGLPALLLTDTANFRNPSYHRPSDLPGSVNADLLAAEADTLAAFVQQATADAER